MLELHSASLDAILSLINFFIAAYRVTGTIRQCLSI